MKTLYILYLNIICLNCFSLSNIKFKTNNGILQRNKLTHNKLAMCFNNNENISNILNATNTITNSFIANDTISKSFYEFIKQRNITLNNEENNIKKNIVEENYVENYITNFVDNYYKNNSQTETHKLLTSYSSYEKYIRETTSKDLKLLTSESSIEWAKIWTYDMIHQPNHFPTFMFQDMFKMRDFGSINNSQTYFYIGFFPKTLNLKQGPYFIGAFELEPGKRQFITHAIIQNPTYYSNNNFDSAKFVEFKRELLALCRDADVFLQFSNLKNTKDERYYFSWLYNE
jgi:hypothetical protein